MLQDFLSYFPEILPPFTILEESIDAFRQSNEYLPQRLVDEFLVQWDGGEVDEFTEYFPCLKLASNDKYHTIIYWKASLLKYDYILVTMLLDGTLISKKVIAGMIVKDDLIVKSVARIDEEKIIHIVTGAFETEFGDYDPNTSKPFVMEIMENGEIVSSN